MLLLETLLSTCDETTVIAPSASTPPPKAAPVPPPLPMEPMELSPVTMLPETVVSLSTRSSAASTPPPRIMPSPDWSPPVMVTFFKVKTPEVLSSTRSPGQVWVMVNPAPSRVSAPSRSRSPPPALQSLRVIDAPSVRVAVPGSASASRSSLSVDTVVSAFAGSAPDHNAALAISAARPAPAHARTPVLRPSDRTPEVSGQRSRDAENSSRAHAAVDRLVVLVADAWDEEAVFGGCDDWTLRASSSIVRMSDMGSAFVKAGRAREARPGVGEDLPVV